MIRLGSPIQGDESWASWSVLAFANAPAELHPERHHGADTRGVRFALQQYGPFGVVIDTISSGNATSSFDRTEFDSNVDSGINALGLGTITGINSVTVTDSVASNNGSQGFFANSTAGAGGIVNMTLTRSLVVDNAVGVEAQGTNATIWLAQSTVTGNGSGYLASGGTLNTFGDNYIANGGNSGSLTPVSKQ